MLVRMRIVLHKVCFVILRISDIPIIGKPAPTVCSILNDRLIEFYIEVGKQFHDRFGKYLQEPKK